MLLCLPLEFETWSGAGAGVDEGPDVGATGAIDEGDAMGCGGLDVFWATFLGTKWNIDGREVVVRT